MANEPTSGRPNQTVVDYVTIVLSPALVMGLVGSLVFFLLEVFYRTDGEWKERLQWILFFYVFGAVLTARIAMNGETFIAFSNRPWPAGITYAWRSHHGVLVTSASTVSSSSAPEVKQ